MALIQGGIAFLAAGFRPAHQPLFALGLMFMVLIAMMFTGIGIERLDEFLIGPNASDQLRKHVVPLREVELTLQLWPECFRRPRIRLDPHSPFLFLFHAGSGNCQLLLGHVDEAADALQRARAANARIYYIHLLLAAALGLRGDTDGAKAALAEFLKLKPELNSLAKIRAASRTTTVIR